MSWALWVMASTMRLALHTADVGISVDTAVDVAKEAADIVLLRTRPGRAGGRYSRRSQDFCQHAQIYFHGHQRQFRQYVQHGRGFFVLKFLPLLPKQILLTNLLTDFPEMAIATDRVDEINIQSPQRWNLDFIKRFMIIFGLLSSVFDYLTFGVLLYIFHAKEKVFQTGWFIESVISAILIVLVVRTRLPFFKSLPGKYLFIATVCVLLLVLVFPLTPFMVWFGFITLPLVYYGWTFLIIVIYLACAEMAKRWFYRKVARSK